MLYSRHRYLITMVNLKSAIIQQLISQLAEEGAAAIKQAYETRDWRNRTFNLHDSYGSAVYANGKLLKWTVRYVGQEMVQPEKELSFGWFWNKGRSMPDYKGNRRLSGDEVTMRGREEVMDFFSQYTPKTKGIELVIAAAMFYANILENGGKNLSHKFHVISQANGIMQGLANKYNGKTTAIETGRVLSVMTTIKDKSWNNG